MSGKTFTTVLPISGGTDSVACLYWWQREFPDIPLLLHHIAFDSDRLEREEAALERTLGWLRERGMGNFRLLRSVFSFGDLGNPIRDTELVSLFVGMVARRKEFAGLRNVIVTTPRSEFERIGESRTERIGRQRRKLVAAVAKRALRPINPVRDMWKWQVIANIPQELFALCHWCRHPQPGGETCGRCHTCLQVAEFYDRGGCHNEEIQPVYAGFDIRG